MDFIYVQITAKKVIINGSKGVICMRRVRLMLEEAQSILVNTIILRYTIYMIIK